MFDSLTFYISATLFLFYLIHRLLLKRPDLLWGVQTLPSSSKLHQVQTIAHRGGRETTIENSKSSFSNAYKHNIDMIELDVHLTKDKQVVVFHDGTLQRMTGNNKTETRHVNDLNYDELPSLTHDVSWDQNKATKHVNNNVMKTEKIPLLTEILDAMPESTTILVEIKPSKTNRLYNIDLVQRTDLILLRYPKLKNRILWFSLHADTCNVLLPQQNKDRPRVTCARDGAIAVIAYWLFLLPFIPSSFFPEILGVVAPTSISSGLLK